MIGNEGLDSTDRRNALRLSVIDLHVSFADRSRRWRHRVSAGGSSCVKAIRGVDLSIREGASLGLVGESGCGKSTLARAIMRLIPIDRGTIILNGRDIGELRGSEPRSMRPKIQMIFQHAQASMNPRMTVEAIVSDPLRFVEGCGKGERIDRAREELRIAGLDDGFRRRFPHELSGGQLQRVAIARALILNPDVLICDEPVSALDVSAQAELLGHLKKIQRERGLTMLFITHDLDVAASICDELAVMYLGCIIESGSIRKIVGQAKHPYTYFLNSAKEALHCDLASDPAVGTLVLGGESPSPVCPPSGCAFHPRCPIATDLCASKTPELISAESQHQDHRVACHHSDRIVELQEITAPVDSRFAQKSAP